MTNDLMTKQTKETKETRYNRRISEYQRTSWQNIRITDHQERT
jgi:hypothetical protein